MIKTDSLSFAYPECPSLLSGISLTVDAGEHVALTGPNGSGKSTLALIIKGVLAPTAGSLTINGRTISDDDSRREIMGMVGLVFQNPDNTFVATTVERELAFGMENIGVPPPEMERRIDEALENFDLARYRYTNPSRLSGGEKQRLALAAVMVMRPSVLILDEPTALLDPANRSRILDHIHEVTANGTTVIHITPFLEEATTADRIIAVGNGIVTADISSADAYTLSDNFRLCGMPDGSGIPDRPCDTPDSSDLIGLDRVSFTYDKGTPFAHTVFDDLSLSIVPHAATAVMGSSGAGKTTLLEIVAGITAPTTGGLSAPDGFVKAMAFQFPEEQLYGDTVAEYASFGPRNVGMRGDEIALSVDAALLSVGLDPASYRDREPHMLSGGEQRRVAIAGVLALHPDLLVLDEPAAGLDRCGLDILYRALRSYVDGGGTLVFSTHDFELAHRLACYGIVMCDGRIETSGTLKNVLSTSMWIRDNVTG